MKILFKILSVSVFFLIGLFVFLNSSNTIAIEASFLSTRVNVGFLIFLCVVLSSLATLLFLMSMDLNLKSNSINVKKQIENAKLSHEIESAKVNQLEAKIKTLEEALKIATKK